MKTAQALLATLAPKLAGSSFSPVLSGALSLLLDNGDSIGNFMPVIFGKQPTAEGGYPRMYTPDATMSLEKAKHVGPIEQTINRRLADMAYYIRDVNVAMRRRSMANRYEIRHVKITYDMFNRAVDYVIELCRFVISDAEKFSTENSIFNEIILLLDATDEQLIQQRIDEMYDEYNSKYATLCFKITRAIGLLNDYRTRWLGELGLRGAVIAFKSLCIYDLGIIALYKEMAKDFFQLRKTDIEEKVTTTIYNKIANGTSTSEGEFKWIFE